MQDSIEFRETHDVPIASVINLYRANDWSSADKPDQLHPALMNSHSLVTAWHEEHLVDLANAISDGFLVVYYPHVVVHPNYQRQGIGQQLMQRLMKRYEGFHQHSVLADKDAVAFFEKCGFERSVCPAMWIYQGDDR